MNLENYYYYFQSAVPERICDDIIKYGNQLKSEKAKVDDNKGEKENLDKRNSEIAWTSDQWIYREIQPYIHKANKNAGWNFQWDSSEHCQFTKYNTGQYYDWHRDGWGESYQKKEGDVSNGKIRKLSVTLSLSDEKDYEGGDLEFDFGDTEPSKKRVQSKCTEIRSKGSLVVFPSSVWHRVCPVKSGSRYSLVMWNLGWPFK